jgi:hypothetical protein
MRGVCASFKVAVSSACMHELDDKRIVRYGFEFAQMHCCSTATGLDILITATGTCHCSSVRCNSGQLRRMPLQNIVDESSSLLEIPASVREGADYQLLLQ